MHCRDAGHDDADDPPSTGGVRWLKWYSGKSFRCAHCPNKRFIVSHDLKRHVIGEHGRRGLGSGDYTVEEGRWKCGLCGRSVTRTAMLVGHHLRSHEGMTKDVYARGYTKEEMAKGQDDNGVNEYLGVEEME